jgi:hypothetical protein
MKWSRLPFLVGVAVIIAASTTAWAWGDQGHEIIAIIAADNLLPSVRDQVAKILGTTSATNSLETAMVAASLRPDTEFRPQDRSTAPWHFIDICLQDQTSDLPARCPGRACVTAKIDEYVNRLKTGDYDKWGASGDLAFVIHLVGDIHQPLHAATDADKGGNCIAVESHPHARNLHAAWDTAVVYALEDGVDSGKPDATAHKLEQFYASQKAADSWNPGGTEDIAWESNQVARTKIYQALDIPTEPCEPEVNSCAHAPAGPLDLDGAYMNKAATVAGEQIVKAGFRLASVLNGIWPSGASPESMR